MEAIAESRMEIDQARLLTYKAADLMDTVGNKLARKEISMIKVVAPRMAGRVIDRAIQIHGGAGVTEDFHLAHAYAAARVLRIVDGPDADLNALNFTLMGAIACATRSIKIVTPYFLPDQALLFALNTASLGGVDVDIVLP